MRVMQQSMDLMLQLLDKRLTCSPMATLIARIRVLAFVVNENRPKKGVSRVKTMDVERACDGRSSVYFASSNVGMTNYRNLRSNVHRCFRLVKSGYRVGSLRLVFLSPVKADLGGLSSPGCPSRTWSRKRYIFVASQIWLPLVDPLLGRRTGMCLMSNWVKA